MNPARRPFVLVRGAGDLATGTIVRLRAAGFLVAALEIDRPTAIRRKVSLSECMYEGTVVVEGVRATRVSGAGELLDLMSGGIVPVLADPGCSSMETLRPEAVVDAILAKRNLGTRMDMAPAVVALGPGFTAGIDVHAVVETNRGHNLGRVILHGSAEPDTGLPGMLGGYGAERVIKAPVAGTVEALRDIGDIVRKDEPVLVIHGAAGRRVVVSPLDGVVRGIIRPGRMAVAGLKIADVDPRGATVDCSSISDKARAIGGGVLEAVMRFGVRPS